MFKVIVSSFLVCSIAFAEDIAVKPERPAEEKPEVLKVKGARLWVPDGGFVERGEGVYMNKVMVTTLSKEIGEAQKELVQFVDENNKLKQENAQKFEVKTTVIMTCVGVGLGILAGGLAVGFASGKIK